MKPWGVSWLCRFPAKFSGSESLCGGGLVFSVFILQIVEVPPAVRGASPVPGGHVQFGPGTCARALVLHVRDCARELC